MTNAGFGPAADAFAGEMMIPFGAVVYVFPNDNVMIVDPPLLFVPVVVIDPQVSLDPAPRAAFVIPFCCVTTTEGVAALTVEIKCPFVPIPKTSVAPSLYETYRPVVMTACAAMIF